MKSKKLCSILLCSIIMCSSSASVLACNSSNNRQAMPIEATNIKIYSENTFSSDFYYDELAKLGFTESEMYDLYLKESNESGVSLTLPNKLAKSVKKKVVYPTKISRSRGGSYSTFPSNPQVGHTYQVTHTITMDDLAWYLGVPGTASAILQCSKRQVAKALVKMLGLGTVGTILAAATAILSVISRCGYNYGVQWTQDWYYGEDNNMSIGWTPGLIHDCKVI